MDAARHATQVLEARDEAALRTMTVRFNRPTPLQLKADIRELREILGLPNFNVNDEGIFPPF
jgi:hypothetical protein